MSLAARVGTAGWSLPARTTTDFPDGGSHLERYATRFDAVEINSSFHRPHRRATYERWAGSVPEQFRFSVKLPKTITHGRRLADPLPLLGPFAEQVSGLGDKLGVLLVQLPPSLDYDEAIAAPFFAALRTAFSVGLACEPRHASWFAAAADAMLADAGVTRVAADPARTAEAASPGGWPGLRYFRLHGSPIIYRSAYDDERLRDYAAAIAAIDSATWCIFDNTAQMAATTDALAMRHLLTM